jgi:phosphoribosyl-AMP cyclohydrolase / phosphoribosyl-ATP pyrophosphohydrolase
MQLNFSKNNGLLPVVIQNADTQVVLMVGYMNREAFAKTQKSGFVWFWSRRRNSLWQKGKTSGNTLTVTNIFVDCDRDTLLIQVAPAGPTCHTGAVSCFESMEAI